MLKYKSTFFSSNHRWYLNIYLLIIDKNMENIYELIHMSFLYEWHFSQHCSTHYIRPHPFCRTLFQICTNSFSSSLFLLFIFYLDKLSSMLISDILFSYIMFTLFTKCWTSFCTFFSCTFLSPSFSCKSSIEWEHPWGRVACF